jgi:hypothetical protein
VGIRRRSKPSERDAIRRGLPISQAARRRTRIVSAFGGASVVVLFAAEAVRIWRLGTLPLTRGDSVIERGLIGVPRQALSIVKQGYDVSETRENVLFNMVASFVVTFGGVRGLTYTIRSRGRLGPIKDITTKSGRHIHHFIPGMALALAAGGFGISSRRDELKRWLALPFGTGIALVLDETALLLELEDVYWSEEGVLSVQAAFAALGLLAALAYASRVARGGPRTAEDDWKAAASAFDDVQLLRRPGRRAQG